jgi:hypothetical protein
MGMFKNLKRDENDKGMAKGMWAASLQHLWEDSLQLTTFILVQYSLSCIGAVS